MIPLALSGSGIHDHFFSTRFCLHALGRSTVTKGVVSRVEPQQYAHGASTHLAIQIDAAINFGNSGGPVLLGKHVVGVAFQNLQGAENIGFVIPTNIIRHFLRDVASSTAREPYAGFCSLGVQCQALENGELRRFKGVQPSESGVLVTKVLPVSSAHGILRAGDVLCAVEGHNVAHDGSVAFRERERIPFDWLLSTKHVGDFLSVRVVRDAQHLELSVPLQAPMPLVPPHQFDQAPKYFIFAGLVFIRLTQPYLHEWGEEWYNTAPRKLCDRALHGDLEHVGDEVVVLASVLTDAITIGYAECVNQILTHVNDVKVTNLAHVRSLVEKCMHGFVRFVFDDHRIVVVDAAAARAALPALLHKHRIPSALSL